MLLRLRSNLKLSSSESLRRDETGIHGNDLSVKSLRSGDEGIWIISNSVGVRSKDVRGLSGLRRKARLFLFGDGVGASVVDDVDEVRESGGIPTSLELGELEPLFHGAFHI